MKSTISPIFVILLMVIGQLAIILLLVVTQYGFKFKRKRKEVDRELDIRIADLKNKRKIAQALGRVEEEEKISEELEKCIRK